MAEIQTHIKGDALRAYADKLMDAGFTVWVSKPNMDVRDKVIPVSWFMYEKNGHVGIVSEGLGGFSHSMPVHPTTRDGSAIAMFDEQWALHVEHAEKVCQPNNIGKYNGGRRFQNEGLTESRKARYIELARDPDIMVPVEVVWQEIQQFKTVVTVPMNVGMTRTKVGKQKLYKRIEAALDELDDEAKEEALDENWHGHRHIDVMNPVWHAVEPPLQTVPKV